MALSTQNIVWFLNFDEQLISWMNSTTKSMKMGAQQIIIVETVHLVKWILIINFDIFFNFHTRSNNFQFVFQS